VARLPLPPEAELRQLLPQGISLAIDPDPLQL
jgi:primosomal protein N' (replication factor Y)